MGLDYVCVPVLTLGLIQEKIDEVLEWTSKHNSVNNFLKITPNRESIFLVFGLVMIILIRTNYFTLVSVTK